MVHRVVSYGGTSLKSPDLNPNYYFFALSVACEVKKVITIKKSLVHCSVCYVHIKLSSERLVTLFLFFLQKRKTICLC